MYAQNQINWIPNCFSKVTHLDEDTFDFIINSLKNTLGNSDSIKCLLIDPEKSTIQFAKCWLRILDELIHSKQIYSNNAFVRFLQKTLISYHNSHVCSTKTALCFTILLWKRIKYTLMRNDLDTKQLSKNLQEILEKSIELVKRNRVLYLPKIDLGKNIKILSRHMNKIAQSSYYNLSSNSEFYKHLLNGITRGQSIFSELLFELLMKHEHANQMLSLNNIFISCSSSGSEFAKNIDRSSERTGEFFYKIFNGFILNLSTFNNEINPSSLILNCIFINGSLTKDHVHLGFNKNLNFAKYSSVLNDDFKIMNSWEENVKNILLNNEIKLLIIREKIDENIKEFCRINSIMVFNNFSSNLEKKFKEFFKCPSFVYIEDFNTDVIFKVRINHHNSSYINIDTLNTSKNFTILIETRLESSKVMLTEYLNHCLKRLSNILTDGFYLNGTKAQNEKYLSEEIKHFNSSNSNQNFSDDEKIIYFDLSKQIVSDAFADFHLMVLANSIDDNLNSDIEIFDDFSSKCEAWRVAFYASRIFLDSDISISN